MSNYGVKLSEETRKKMSDRNKGENNYFYGKTPSKEHIEKLREIEKNRSGKNHPFYGKRHSDESKLKNSNAHIGRNGNCISNSETVICLSNNKIYESMSLAEQNNKSCELRGRLKNNIYMSGIDENNYFGLFWMRYNEYIKYSKDEIDLMIEICKYKNDHRVICLNDKKIYKSCKHACEEMNFVGYEENLRRACKSKTHVYHKDNNGNCYKWMYYKDYIKKFEEVV